MVDAVEYRGGPPEAVAEARRVMSEMGRRAGDQWAEHREAGIVRSGQQEHRQIEVVTPDGITILTDVKKTVSLNKGADTLYLVDSAVMTQIFPKPKWHI